MLSDQRANYPRNFNEMSTRQVLGMKINISLRGETLIMTSNSHNYPTKKYMVLVTRMNVSILVMKG